MPLFLAVAGDLPWVFIELGAAIVGLAILARVANRVGISAIPLYLIGGLAFGNGGLLPLRFTEDFVHIGDFLRETDAPPAIRAALYDAAALIPGAKLMGPQTDPVGRAGLGVAFVTQQGQLRSELIFDQQTAKLLAEEYFGPGGKLADWTAYLRSEVVTSHPDYPIASSGSASG